MLVQIDGFCLCLLVMKHVNPIPNLLSRCIYMAPKPDGVRLDGLCEGGVLGYYHCFFSVDSFQTGIAEGVCPNVFWLMIIVRYHKIPREQITKFK